MSQRNWSQVVLRVFGLLHLVFAGFGLWLVGSTVFGLVSSGNVARLGDATAPYTSELFVVRTVINAIFLLVLVLAGIFLLQARIQGVGISNALFMCMVAYFLLPILLPDGGPTDMSIGASAGIGNMGIGPQLITGYPIIALVGLNLARRRLRVTSSRN